VKQSTCCELASWKCEVRDVKQSTCVVSWRAGNPNGHGERSRVACSERQRKELIDTKNTADTTIYSIEKSLGEYREKIPSEIAKEIEDAVADLRSASSGDDLNEIKAKIEAANKAVSKIGEHMSGGSGGGSAPGGGSEGGSDQAPEAEYEEVKK
ncbi:hypothetical protein ISN45_At04g034170, partial [Arabidopsis thaliana x Arabidopsis arenosa]